MSFWLISSKSAHDESIKNWKDTTPEKWTIEAFLKERKFFPAMRKNDFKKGDQCILNVYGSKKLIATFEIASKPAKNKEGHTFYEIDHIDEWDHPIRREWLPKKYTEFPYRSMSINLEAHVYYELIGISNFVGNLKLNFKNEVVFHMQERVIERMMVENKTLKRLGLEVVKEQYEVAKGNIIDLLCTDQYGDLVVVEIKKKGADQTVGQLARYISYVKERAKQTQRVRGLIFTARIDDQLLKAAKAVNFDVALYQIIIK